MLCEANPGRGTWIAVKRSFSRKPCRCMVKSYRLERGGLLRSVSPQKNQSLSSGSTTRQGQPRCSSRSKLHLPEDDSETDVVPLFIVMNYCLYLVELNIALVDISSFNKAISSYKVEGFAVLLTGVIYQLLKFTGGQTTVSIRSPVVQQ